MALNKTFVSEQTGVSASYVRIGTITVRHNIDGSKVTDVHLDVFLSHAARSSSMSPIPELGMDVSLDGAVSGVQDIFGWAYDQVKLRPEFAGSTDV